MIIKDVSEDFQLHPEGFLQGVCVDVVDLGLKPTQYGDKHKCRIVWETTALMPDGRPFVIMESFNVSLNTKSKLRKDLESWRGAKFNEQDLAGFDMEKLIGANCQLQIIHATDSEGKQWANVQSVVPLSAGMKPIQASGKYTRVQDRNPSDQPQGKVENDQPTF